MHRNSIHRPLVGLAVLGAVVVPAVAQPAASWNRKVEAIAATPTPATGMFEVRPYLSVHAADLAKPVDLSTEVLVLVNGTTVAIETIDLIGNPAASGCAGLDCGDEPCICTPPPVVCECGPAIVVPSPVPVPLQPGDEIMVLLRPAPGAAPDNDESDDQIIQPFHGDPLMWNRRLRDVSIVPAGGPAASEGPTNEYQIITTWDFTANYDGLLQLGAEIEVQRNGVPVGTFPSAAIDDLFWNQCLTGCGPACVLDASGQTFGTCQDDPDFPIPCSCRYQPVPDMIGPIQASPGDEITVILRPVPGALPELPGFEEDEETGVLCPGDFDADGIVGTGDLLFLLGNWGPCPDPCPPACPADLDGDCAVGTPDLLQLLGTWGPCFPV